MLTCNPNTEFMLKFPLNRPFLFLDQSPFKFYSVVIFWFFIFSQICSYLQFSSTALSETKFPLQSMVLPVPTHINHYVHLLPCLPTPNGLLIPSDCMNFHVLRFFVIKNQFVAIDLLLFGPIWSFFLFHLSSIHFLH